jgi:predicted Kef-type K+ transport protein
VRLGQISEFSLLVIYLALQIKLINPIITYTVEAATIFTFIISSYWIVMRYPTPMASSDKLRRD